jgi:hypothetical protein
MFAANPKARDSRVTSILLMWMIVAGMCVVLGNAFAAAVQ